MKACAIALLAAGLPLAAAAPAAGPYRVHVVAHSHDDVGWQRTAEGYYEVEVRNILANVVTALSADTNKTFVWEESFFLQRWWADGNTSAAQRSAWQSLLASGRLELIGGGWTMHDEESTTVWSTANNMEYGLTWLARTFGAQYRPRFGWHIDPSGHAALTPTLFSELGYDAVVIDRIPAYLKQEYKRNQSLQFLWTAADTTLLDVSILTFALDTIYCTPSLSGITPQALAHAFYAEIQRKAAFLASNVMFVPFGCDFAFQNIDEWSLFDSILGYVSANPEEFPLVAFAKYSTLGQYFDDLHADNAAGNVLFPTMGKRDYHAYTWCWNSSDPTCFNEPQAPDWYWRTGMYTSRPALKGMTRVLDATLHEAETWYAAAALGAPAVNASRWADTLPALGYARSVSGIMTHHDAITGTAYYDCVISPPGQCDCYDDYLAQMTSSIAGVDAAAGVLKGLQLSLNASAPVTFINATTAAYNFTDKNVLIVAVGNPLGWARQEVVRLLLPDTTISPGTIINVVDLRNKDVAIPSQKVIDTFRNGTWLYWAADVPPMGTVSYALLPNVCSAPDGSACAGTAAAPPPRRMQTGFNTTLSNGAITLTFDPTGRLSTWTNGTSNINVPIQHSFTNFSEMSPNSGSLTGATVYAFVIDDAFPPAPVVPEGATINLTITQNGPFVWEATQSIDDWLVHTFRMFAPAATFPPNQTAFQYAQALDPGYVIEMQTKIGPLPTFKSSSITSSLTPGAGCMNSNTSTNTGPATLTTDASGFQTLTRPAYNASWWAQGQVWPAWPGWDFTFTGCDGDSAGILSTAYQRPMGVGLQANTTVMQMLHRRQITPDDNRGNDSVVMDDIVVTSIADSSVDVADYLLRRQVTARLVAHPLTLHAAIYLSQPLYSEVGAASVTAATVSLPPSVHLHGISRRDAWYPSYGGPTSEGVAHVDGVYGVRFQQLPYAAGPVTFDFAGWLAGVTPSTVNETTTDFNVPMAAAQAQRLQWRTNTAEKARARYTAGATPTTVMFDTELVRSFTFDA